MLLNPIDKSNYLRGLLILVKSSKSINEIERLKIKEVSNALGFNRGFVDNALNELIDNEYLTENPPKFSNYKLAESFIKDALRISLIVGNLNINKLNSLMKFAIQNDLSKQWFYIELEQLIENSISNINKSFEIENYLNENLAVA